jgi:hypothetical protein
MTARGRAIETRPAAGQSWLHVSDGELRQLSRGVVPVQLRRDARRLLESLEELLVRHARTRERERRPR